MLTREQKEAQIKAVLTAARALYLQGDLPTIAKIRARISKDISFQVVTEAMMLWNQSDKTELNRLKQMGSAGADPAFTVLKKQEENAPDSAPSPALTGLSPVLTALETLSSRLTVMEKALSTYQAEDKARLSREAELLATLKELLEEIKALRHDLR